MDKIKQKCQMLRADMKLKVHDDNYKKNIEQSIFIPPHQVHVNIFGLMLS